MKKFKLFTLLFVAIGFGFTACDDDDTTDPIVDPENDNVVISANITEDTEWTNENVYQLGGRIAVEAGATLTIEAGTIIKGEAGTGSNATALLVARGATLIAEGTAESPIIFTSIADEIEPGQIVSPNLDPDQNGLWGGVIVLGNAPISASAAEVQIEGIPTSDANGLYGGDDAEDNSGILKYISIRHGGSNIGSGNEINGLSLGGVGSGTVIENIEVVGNQDDGIEWFGGTVNVTNALIWNVGDDAMDTDQGWSGTMDNFLIVTPTGHAFELDGPEGTTLLDVQHTFVNGTVIAASFNEDDEVERGLDDLINTDDNSRVLLKDIFFTSIAEGQGINRLAGDPEESGLIEFEGIVIDVLDGTTISDYLPEGAEVPAGITAGATTTAKADVSVFSNWSWAGASGALSGL